MRAFGASSGAALREFRQTLQRAFACVTDGVLISKTDGLTASINMKPRLRRSGGQFVTFSVRHYIALTSDESRPARERWVARTVNYFYSLDDAAGREIVAYHWHPVGRSHVDMPHLHIGAGAGRLVPELTTAHLHTGAVAPTAILWLLIESFGVAARRSDWAQILIGVEDDLGVEDAWQH